MKFILFLIPMLAIAFPVSNERTEKIDNIDVLDSTYVTIKAPLELDLETIFTHITTPSNPSAGFIKVYAKSDDNLYILNSAGGEVPVGSTPTTTQGDLIIRGVSIDERLAIGANNEILVSNGTTLSYQPLPSTSPTANIGDMVVNDGGGAASDIALAPGTATYVLTSNGAGSLPTYQAPAVSTTLDTKGQLQGFSTVNANVGPCLAGEHLVFDTAEATGWKCSASLSGTLNPVTDWQAFTMVIEGTGSNPTKASSPVQDNARWRRVGSDMEIDYLYFHTNNTGAAAGTGDYNFKIPGGHLIDMTKIVGDNGGSHIGNIVGMGWVSDGTVNNNAAAQDPAAMEVFDSTSLKMGTYVGSTRVTVTVGPGSHAPLNGPIVQYRFQAKVPILGWTSGLDAAVQNKKLLSLVAKGNAGEAITANVTDIPFIEIEDVGNSWNGSQFTAPESGEYLIIGGVAATSVLNGAVGTYIDGVFDKFIGLNIGGVTGVGQFEGVVKLTEGQILSLRLDESKTLQSTQPEYHHIHIQELPTTGVITGTFENINSTESYQMRGDGNAGAAITALTERIDFTIDKENISGRWTSVSGNGPDTYTAVGKERHIITGQITMSGNIGTRLYLYKNNAYLEQIKDTLTYATDHVDFSTTIDMVEGDTFSIRTSVTLTMVNEAGAHFISITQASDFEAVVVNLMDSTFANITQACKVTGSGTPTIDTSSGTCDWVSGVVRNSTGNYTWTISGFAQKPVCTCSVDTDADLVCVANVTSSTSFTTITKVPSSIYLDRNPSVHCTGVRSN